tara:strand:- start:223329 stop:223733 length:405 start_codon:yes stop_codon:yes gene_type:complete
MVNKITASITFNFKGETFTPSLELDLDTLMQRYNAIPPLHETLAAENNIDIYSYQYEILLVQDIQFSDAKGDAASFLNEDKFDRVAYEQFWFQKNILNHLQKIINTELGLDDIAQHPKLIHVMLAAFQYGRDYH